MNHAMAAEFRNLLNASDYVDGPDNDHTKQLRLVRVQQPGYLNGEPMYEVVIRVDRDSIHLPTEFLELVSDRGCYLRLDGDDLHIRDWRTEDEA